MEKDKQFFPLENLLIGNKKVGKLLDKHGWKGLGAYIMILTEIRFADDYQTTLGNLKGQARRCKGTMTILHDVLYNYNLFEIEEEENEPIISSPYINRVMKRYDDKVAKHAEISAKGYNKSIRGAGGRFTAAGGTKEKNRKEKNKTTTTVVTNDVVGGGEWEEYLEEVVNDSEWMQLLATSSGLGRYFAKYSEFIVDTFRKHATLQGTSHEMLSARDVKAYFANYLRQGTPTQQRLEEQLARCERIERESSPYRFETIDPETGERSYFGNPIPPHASPRPNDNAVWAESIKEWI